MKTKYDYAREIAWLEYQLSQLPLGIQSTFVKADELVQQLNKAENELESIATISDTMREYRNIVKRTTRAKERITSILDSSKALFLTLTFTDDTLASTTQQTRRRYVVRFLNTISSNYVANIDFGKRNEREHYHAVVQADKIDFSKWQYGAINGVKIRTSSNPLQLAKYINKLSNHALKETTKGNKLIYSRLTNQNNLQEPSNCYKIALSIFGKELMSPTK